jgi:hypothetical protein
MSTLVTEEVTLIPEESRASAVTWSAIAAGGVAAAGFSLFLIKLGAAIGLTAISPWEGSGVSAGTISVAAGISLCLISIMASALGGYLTGRLRTRWVGLHSDETYFRDTAHGFLAWAFATVLSALIAAMAATSLVGRTTQGAASNPSLSDTTAYYTDMLLRSERAAPTATPAAQASNEELGRIVNRALVRGAAFSAADRSYVAQRVAARTGLSQEEAERRVDTVVAEAKAAADAARRAAAKLAMWFAAALLCGALAASFAAAEGGRERDS